jgi:hypothetical protein
MGWFGGGSGSGWDSSVANYAALPAATGSGAVYLVENSTGFLWNKRKGLYRDEGVGTWNRLSNAEFQVLDNEATFSDNTDDTKKMDFELSGITTGNTRTLTIPDASGTIALLEVNNTFTTNQTAPSVTLSKVIASSTSTTGLQITAADGVTPLMNVDTVNGRLGFGTITPAKQIDITKDIQLVNTTAADEGVIYKGSYAFFHNFSHPTGGSAKPTGRNLFVGPRAGNFTMGSAATSTDHASFNLAIGDQALLSNQLGYHNTSIGYLASALNQDGAFNIAIGAYALYANVDTDSNIGIGYSSGRSVTGGVDSIFIGSGSGFNGSQKTNPDNVLCLGSNTYCTTDNTYMYGNTDVEKHIFQSGSVGIGTDTPSFDLEVNGVAKSDMMRQDGTWHAYGGFQDESETISISAVDTWTHVTNSGNDLWTGLEADGLTLSGDVMTFTNGGDYVGSLSMTISGSNGKDFQIRLYNITQTTQMGYHIGATTTGASNFTNITLPLYIEASSSDQMRIEIECTTDGSDPTLRSAVFYISYLHD